MYWYEEEVKRLEIESSQLLYRAETLFYGSSSIRLWSSLYDDFQKIKPVNLGFGGSTMAACVWYFERIMHPFSPKMMVLYAGDNDIGDGRHPEEVFIFFQQMVVKIQQQFGNLPCRFVSLKPSLKRWHIANKFRYTNELIKNEIQHHLDNWKFIDVFSAMLSTNGYPVKEFFADDGLHLSAMGYQLWKDVISNCLST